MKIARDTAGAAGSSKSELVLRDLTVQRWPIDKLIPYARNARTHSDAQVAQVAASIIEFGWTNPILVGGDGVIIAGHARLAAARKLGMTEAPVIVLDHLTPAQRRALVLADNRLALNAGWDEEMLHVELESLEKEGFDLDLAGFTDEEIEELLRDPEETFEGLTDDNAIPEEPEQAVTVLGDVWVMGEHRLLCGDATNPEAMKTVLAGGLAGMVFTDPPYNVDYEGKSDHAGAGADRQPPRPERRHDRSRDQRGSGAGGPGRGDRRPADRIARRNRGQRNHQRRGCCGRSRRSRERGSRHRQRGESVHVANACDCFRSGGRDLADHRGAGAGGGHGFRPSFHAFSNRAEACAGGHGRVVVSAPSSGPWGGINRYAFWPPQVFWGIAIDHE